MVRSRDVESESDGRHLKSFDPSDEPALKRSIDIAGFERSGSGLAMKTVVSVGLDQTNLAKVFPNPRRQRQLGADDTTDDRAVRKCW